MVLKHIEFVRLDAQTAMVVLVGENGTVENRIVQLPPGLTPSALTQASNYLASFAVGKTLSEARLALAAQREAQLAELDELTRKLVEAGRATLADDGQAAPTLIVRGRANLINDTMASEELERVRRLFDELESRSGLIELLGDTEKAEGGKIFIGSENAPLSGSSVILSPYKDANEKVVGVVGVIGPTGSTTRASCRWSTIPRMSSAACCSAETRVEIASQVADMRANRKAGQPAADGTGNDE